MFTFPFIYLPIVHVYMSIIYCYCIVKMVAERGL